MEPPSLDCTQVMVPSAPVALTCLVSKLIGRVRYPQKSAGKVKWIGGEKAKKHFTFDSNITKTPGDSKCVWCLVYNVKDSDFRSALAPIQLSPQAGDIERRAKTQRRQGLWD